MSTLTQEIITRSPESDGIAQYPEASELINNTLARVESLPDDEIDRQFNAMIETSKRIHLPGLVREDALSEIVDQIPQVEVLIEKIHDTAELIISEEQFDSNSTVIAHNLGIAYDITGDSGILERTLEALDDTHDYGIEEIKLAMSIAQEEGEQYTVIRNRLKREAKQAMLARTAIPVQMSNRDEFEPGSNDHLLSRRTNTLGSINARRVQMNAYEDLLGEERTTATPTEEQPFTSKNAKKLLRQLAVRSFFNK